MELELPELERTAQPVLELEPAHRGAAQVVVEEHVAVLAVRLRAVHRSVAVADQLRRRRVRAIGDGQPDAGRDEAALAHRDHRGG